jgi:hypothetical protein
MARRRVPRYQRDGVSDEATPRPPSERIEADRSQQAPNNSYDPPRYYEDRTFAFVDCGKDEVWTAEQQQWWYEVAKGSIYSRAVCCRECRQARRAKREAGLPTAPQPIRTIGALLRRVRVEIEPALLAAGFELESVHKPKDWRERFWIDYRRDSQVFSFAYEQREARFIAELMDAKGECHVVAIAQIPQPPTMKRVYATIMEFAAEIITFLANLRSGASARD